MLEELIDVLTEHGRTGMPGDDVITILDVNQMVRIRTGDRGTHIV